MNNDCFETVDNSFDLNASVRWNLSFFALCCLLEVFSWTKEEPPGATFSAGDFWFQPIFWLKSNEILEIFKLLKQSFQITIFATDSLSVQHPDFFSQVGDKEKDLVHLANEKRSCYRQTFTVIPTESQAQPNAEPNTSGTRKYS